MSSRETAMLTGVDRGDSKVDRLSKRDYATTLGAAVYTAVELNNEADAKKLFAQISTPYMVTSVTPSLMNSVNRKYASLLTKLGHNQEAESVLASERCRAQCKLGFDALRSNDLSSLAYLSHDLLEHSQMSGAGQVVGYIRALIARVQPSDLRDRRCLAVARAAIEGYDKHTDSHLSRIVFRAEPGSFEASAAVDTK